MFFMATWPKTSQRFLPWASDVLISTYLAYTPAFVSSRLQFNIIILIDFGAKGKWITKKGMMVYYSTLGIDGVRLHMCVGSHDWKERSSSTWDKESLLGLLAVFLFCFLVMYIFNSETFLSPTGQWCVVWWTPRWQICETDTLDWRNVLWRGTYRKRKI